VAVAARIRRAGVRFEARSRARPEALPRMDVAALAGFAASGPFHLPIAVEDPVVARELFGAPLALPNERTAHLHGALASFFANGGRRCWVLRVGDETTAVRTTLPLPGVLVRTEARPDRPAELLARSAGSAFDGLQVRCALQSTPLEVTAVTSPDELRLAPPPGTTLARGDLVRVHGGDGTVLAAIAAVEQDSARLRLERAATLSPGDEMTGRIGMSGQLGRVMIRRTAGGWALDVLGDIAPPPQGAAVSVEAGGVAGSRLWILVDGLGAAEGPASYAVLGRGTLIADDPPSAVPASAAWAELLTLEVRAGAPGAPEARLAGIGLAAPHPRWAGALPADDDLYAARQPDPGTLAAAAAAPRFPLAGDMLAEDAVLLPFGLGAELSPALPASIPHGSALVRCGLSSGGSDVFLDRQLVGLSSAALVANAAARRAAGERLRGIHLLLGLDEATLCAAPDATHPAWKPGELEDAPESSLEEPAPRLDPAAFARCDVRVLITPRPRVLRATPAGRIDIAWSATDADDAIYEVQAAPRPDDLTGSDPRYSGHDLETTLFVAAGSVAYVRVRALAGASQSDWSRPVVVDCRAPAGEQLASADSAWDGARAVHGALLRVSAARGDLLAVIALPEQATAARSVAHASALRADLAGEPRTLGYGMLADPWPLVGAAAPLPPDGPALGILARRAIERGCWVAPAGVALRDALGLTQALRDDDRDARAMAQIDVLEATPTGVQWLMQDTLSDEPELRPVNVRRLIALVRRAAVRRGQRWVFEPNNATLHRGIRRSFEAMMAELDGRGAFAGATASERWRVDVLDRDADRDAGRVIVELRVAPSLPLRFLTIRLVLDAERGVAAEVV
jgi:hypothetical protein